VKDQLAGAGVYCGGLPHRLYKYNLRAVLVLVCGLVAGCLERWTCNQHVANSNPGHRAIECNSGQVVHTHVRLSPTIKFGTGVSCEGSRIGLASHWPCVTDSSGSWQHSAYAPLGYGTFHFYVGLSEGSFVPNGVVQIPEFDANPSPSPKPNPMPIRFGQMTLRTSDLSPYVARTCI